MKLTENLAELMGILYGDGYMNHYSNGHYLIEIAGDQEKDLEYHKTFISGLVEELFFVKPKLILRKDQKTVITRVSSKKIFLLLEELGMPKGKKIKLIVPLWIKNNSKFFLYFIRGIYDTDGSLILRKRRQHSISLSLKNKEPILEIKEFLENKGYFLSFVTEETYDKRGFNSTMFCLRINRKKMINSFWKEVGSNNPYKIEKFKKMASMGSLGFEPRN